MCGERLTGEGAAGAGREERTMKNAWGLVGTVAGYLGIVICAAAIAGRFYGEPLFLGYEARAWLLLGMASMLLGCWAKLEAK
jgi:hypothetical protein